MNNQRFLTRRQTAAYLGVALTTVDALIKQEDNPLPHLKLGTRVLIPSDMLEKWILSKVVYENRYDNAAIDMNAKKNNLLYLKGGDACERLGFEYPSEDNAS